MFARLPPQPSVAFSAYFYDTGSDDASGPVVKLTTAGSAEADALLKESISRYGEDEGKRVAEKLMERMKAKAVAEAMRRRRVRSGKASDNVAVSTAKDGAARAKEEAADAHQRDALCKERTIYLLFLLKILFIIFNIIFYKK